MPVTLWFNNRIVRLLSVGPDYAGLQQGQHDADRRLEPGLFIRTWALRPSTPNRRKLKYGLLLQTKSKHQSSHQHCSLRNAQSHFGLSNRDRVTVISYCSHHRFLWLFEGETFK